MAIGKASDFKVYQEELNGIATELVEQEVRLFNEASGGALSLGTDALRGDQLKESFYVSESNLVSRRDTTSTAAATATKLTQNEEVSIKIPKKIVNDNLRNAFLQVGQDPMAMVSIVAQQAAIAVIQGQLNAALASAKGAIFNNSDATFDARGIPTDQGTQINGENLIDGLAKFGDQANQRIGVWVMHSRSWYDLLKDQVVEKIDGVTSFNLFEGTPATLGIPVLVTDDANLLISGARDSYLTYGLSRDALRVTISEPMNIIIDEITGLENQLLRYHAEWAETVGVKGYAYQQGVGGNNPSDATLATSTSWSQVATDVKSTAGICVATHKRTQAVLDS